MVVTEDSELLMKIYFVYFSINKTTMNLNLLTKGPMPVPKHLKKNGAKGGKKKVTFCINLFI